MHCCMHHTFVRKPSSTLSYTSLAPVGRQSTGLATNPSGGFLMVDGTLTCQSAATGRPVPGVFAVGDIASMINNERPKAGVFAVRQVRRYLSGAQFL